MRLKRNFVELYRTFAWCTRITDGFLECRGSVTCLF